ncbi:MAG TPA: FHA domain-containing protein, partial [Candidatus Aminicenantes bacterium]|nr:FHA domain-containing protein [Candidatus Aminicenantes bacterium]
VTVVGQVQAVIPNPAGTTRGTYTMLDESCPNPLTIRTNDLPPVSRNFRVRGVLIQDPAQANVPLMKEISRSSPGMTNTTLYLLIAAGAAFLFLLIVFIILLTKPKPRPAAEETIRPAAPVDPSKTTRIAPPPAAPAAAPGGAKTRVFLNLGADIIIEKGPDKGKEFPLHRQVTTIGRPGSRKNEIEINDDTVSKEQASIYYDNAKKEFTIADESATNPTRVDGRAISGPTPLKNGAVIELGRTVLIFKKS